MADPSFYTGPQRQRLQARDWPAVVASAAAGVLDETSWVELKERIPASSKKANLELAKDLASLSVDGGVYIVGVTDKTHEVVGTDLSGLVDRVVQVAAGRIYPSLHVDPYPVPHPNQPGLGLLIVSVSASALAPHMVEDKYWGRTACGKRPLNDAEVAHLFERRRQRRSSLQLQVLAMSETLDPVPADQRHHGHLYVLLKPLDGTGASLSDQLRGKLVVQLCLSALDRFTPQFHPSLHSLTHNLSHPSGLLASSVHPAETREEEALLRLFIADDGAVQAVLGRGTRTLQAREDRPEVEVVSPGQILELTHSLVMLAGHLGTEHLGYWGEWEAAVRLTHLRGLYPSVAHLEFSLRQFHPYPEAEYFWETRTTTRELTEAPATVVQRLVGRLLRDRTRVGHLQPRPQAAATRTAAQRIRLFGSCSHARVPNPGSGRSPSSRPAASRCVDTH